MKKGDYHYRFFNGPALAGARDAFFLAALAVRSLFGMDQASLNALVTKGHDNVPKSIRCRDQSGRFLSAIFNGFLAASLAEESYQITTGKPPRR